ncbi:MAG: aldehyde dehydrogenase family protein, partial [Planctomycetota bacterium]
PGVQIVQAIAAGNAVLVKPAPGGVEVMEIFRNCLMQAGVPDDLVQILDSSIETASQAIELGVDKVFLTGSAETGRRVLEKLSPRLTPAAMELSGCDAVFVADQADVERAARCVYFALRLNGGATCIAPRRIFLTDANRDAFLKALNDECQGNELEASYDVPCSVIANVRAAAEQAITSGSEILHGKLPEDQGTDPKQLGRMRALVLNNVDPRLDLVRSDLFAPVTSIMTVSDIQEAVQANRHCPYGLGVSIFAPQNFAEHLASEVEAGCVVVNDIIVPTADPRVSFGGRDQSGFGMTRGPEGLREMTRPKVLCTRHGKWLPHLDQDASQDFDLLSSLMQFVHGAGLRSRFEALKLIIASGRTKKPESKE